MIPLNTYNISFSKIKAFGIEVASAFEGTGGCSQSPLIQSIMKE
jgi:hypothetical protein